MTSRRCSWNRLCVSVPPPTAPATNGSTLGAPFTPFPVLLSMPQRYSRVSAWKPPHLSLNRCLFKYILWMVWSPLLHLSSASVLFQISFFACVPSVGCIIRRYPHTQHPNRPLRELSNRSSTLLCRWHLQQIGASGDSVILPWFHQAWTSRASSGHQGHASQHWCLHKVASGTAHRRAGLPGQKVVARPPASRHS